MNMNQIAPGVFLLENGVVCDQAGTPITEAHPLYMSAMQAYTQMQAHMAQQNMPVNTFGGNFGMVNHHANNFSDMGGMSSNNPVWMQNQSSANSNTSFDFSGGCTAPVAPEATVMDLPSEVKRFMATDRSRLPPSLDMVLADQAISGYILEQRTGQSELFRMELSRRGNWWEIFKIFVTLYNLVEPELNLNDTIQTSFILWAATYLVNKGEVTDRNKLIQATDIITKLNMVCEHILSFDYASLANRTEEAEEDNLFSDEELATPTLTHHVETLEESVMSEHYTLLEKEASMDRETHKKLLGVFSTAEQHTATINETKQALESKSSVDDDFVASVLDNDIYCRDTCETTIAQLNDAIGASEGSITAVTTYVTAFRVDKTALDGFGKLYAKAIKKLKPNTLDATLFELQEPGPVAIQLLNKMDMQLTMITNMVLRDVFKIGITIGSFHEDINDLLGMVKDEMDDIDTDLFASVLTDYLITSIDILPGSLKSEKKPFKELGELASTLSDGLKDSTFILPNSCVLCCTSLDQVALRLSQLELNEAMVLASNITPRLIEHFNLMIEPLEGSVYMILHTSDDAEFRLTASIYSDGDVNITKIK